jgi:hypothetical protein
LRSCRLPWPATCNGQYVNVYCPLAVCLLWLLIKTHAQVYRRSPAPARAHVCATSPLAPPDLSAPARLACALPADSSQLCSEGFPAYRANRAHCSWRLCQYRPVNRNAPVYNNQPSAQRTCRSIARSVVQGTLSAPSWVAVSAGELLPGAGALYRTGTLPAFSNFKKRYIICRPFTTFTPRRLLICSPWRVTTCPPSLLFSTSSEPCWTP